MRMMTLINMFNYLKNFKGADDKSISMMNRFCSSVTINSQ